MGATAACCRRTECGCSGGLSYGLRHQCRRHPLLGIPVASSLGSRRSLGVTELLTPRQPRLVVQGSKDSFGTAGGAPSGHRQGGRHHSCRAARGWSQLPNRKVFSR